MHISVTKWCIVRSGALWVLWNRSIVEISSSGGDSGEQLVKVASSKLIDYHIYIYMNKSSVTTVAASVAGATNNTTASTATATAATTDVIATVTVTATATAAATATTTGFNSYRRDSLLKNGLKRKK